MSNQENLPSSLLFSTLLTSISEAIEAGEVNFGGRIRKEGKSLGEELSSTKELTPPETEQLTNIVQNLAELDNIYATYTTIDILTGLAEIKDPKAQKIILNCLTTPNWQINHQAHRLLTKAEVLYGETFSASQSPKDFSSEKQLIELLKINPRPELNHQNQLNEPMSRMIEKLIGEEEISQPEKIETALVLAQIQANQEEIDVIPDDLSQLARKILEAEVIKCSQKPIDAMVLLIADHHQKHLNRVEAKPSEIDAELNEILKNLVLNYPENLPAMNERQALGLLLNKKNLPSNQAISAYDQNCLTARGRARKLIEQDLANQAKNIIDSMQKATNYETKKAEKKKEQQKKRKEAKDQRGEKRRELVLSQQKEEGNL